MISHLLADFKAIIAKGDLPAAIRLLVSLPAGDESLPEFCRVGFPALLAARQLPEAMQLLGSAAAIKPNLRWLVEMQVQAAHAMGNVEVLAPTEI